MTDYEFTRMLNLLTQMQLDIAAMKRQLERDAEQADMRSFQNWIVFAFGAFFFLLLVLLKKAAGS